MACPCASGGCPSCAQGGCPIRLTQAELDFLVKFAELPFLPLSRSLDGEHPLYLEPGLDPRETTETLEWLHLKGLISLDYDLPLTNFAYTGYEKTPVRGSMALTLRGQEVLDSLEIQGATP